MPLDLGLSKEGMCGSGGFVYFFSLFFFRTFAATLFFLLFILSLVKIKLIFIEGTEQSKAWGMRRVWEGIFDHGLNRRYIYSWSGFSAKGTGFFLRSFAFH